MWHKLSIVTNVAQITIVTDVSILLKSVIKVPFKYITSVFYKVWLQGQMYLCFFMISCENVFSVFKRDLFRVAALFAMLTE